MRRDIDRARTCAKTLTPTLSQGEREPEGTKRAGILSPGERKCRPQVGEVRGVRDEFNRMRTRAKTLTPTLSQGEREPEGTKRAGILSPGERKCRPQVGEVRVR